MIVVLVRIFLVVKKIGGLLWRKEEKRRITRGRRGGLYT